MEISTWEQRVIPLPWPWPSFPTLPPELFLAVFHVLCRCQQPRFGRGWGVLLRICISVPFGSCYSFTMFSSCFINCDSYFVPCFLPMYYLFSSLLKLACIVLVICFVFLNKRLLQSDPCLILPWLNQTWHNDYVYTYCKTVTSKLTSTIISYYCSCLRVLPLHLHVFDQQMSSASSHSLLLSIHGCFKNVQLFSHQIKQKETTTDSQDW